jgi:hypothetical protein
MTEMYPQDVDQEITATVRRPIQCEGIERGPKRMADVAASGAVIPQGPFGKILGDLLPF